MGRRSRRRSGRRPRASRRVRWGHRGCGLRGAADQVPRRVLAHLETRLLHARGDEVPGGQLLVREREAGHAAASVAPDLGELPEAAPEPVRVYHDPPGATGGAHDGRRSVPHLENVRRRRGVRGSTITPAPPSRPGETTRAGYPLRAGGKIKTARARVKRGARAAGAKRPEGPPTRGPSGVCILVLTGRPFGSPQPTRG